MGILNKLMFWKKTELPKLPEEDFTDSPPQLSQEPFPPSYPEPRRYEPTPPPNFNDQPNLNEQQNNNNEFQVVSSKLDVLNAKIEVLNEKISNIERHVNKPPEKW
jgi:hypothetical protein